MRAGKSPRRGHGHISTLHIWWARRPLTACRAVICAALWPEPADALCPQPFRDTMARRGQREPQLSLVRGHGQGRGRRLGHGRPGGDLARPHCTGPGASVHAALRGRPQQRAQALPGRRRHRQGRALLEPGPSPVRALSQPQRRATHYAIDLIVAINDEEHGCSVAAAGHSWKSTVSCPTQRPAPAPPRPHAGPKAWRPARRACAWARSARCPD